MAKIKILDSTRLCLDVEKVEHSSITGGITSSLATLDKNMGVQRKLQIALPEDSTLQRTSGLILKHDPHVTRTCGLICT